MARFSSTGVCLLAFFLLVAAAAMATRPGTTITTVEINVNDQPTVGAKCRQQIQVQRLNSCRRYLTDGSRLTAASDGGWREEFPRCCEELERINQQCRCEAVKQVAEQQRQTGELQGREMREMLLTAESLPGLCRIQPRYCQNIRGGSSDPMFF